MSETKERKEKMITVKIIERQGASVLVEYHKRKKPVRKIVPAAELKGNDVSDLVLEVAQDYGDAFDVKLPQVSQAVLLHELHRQGIWTAQDLLTLSASARGVLSRLFVVPALQELLDYSQEVIRK